MNYYDIFKTQTDINIWKKYIFDNFREEIGIFGWKPSYIYIKKKKNTFGCKHHYKYFHTTMHCIKGEEVKIRITIKGVTVIYMCSVYETYS